jgi:hypothetical protein
MFEEDYEENLFGLKGITKKQKLQQSRKLTNEFQTFVKNWLNKTGQFRVWRNNNIPSTRHEVIVEEIPAYDAEGNAVIIKTEHVKVHFKKNQKEVSTFDLIGYRIRDGKHVEIEIKKGKDELDEDQEKHLKLLQASGCISFATKDKTMFLHQIAKFIEEKPLAF